MQDQAKELLGSEIEAQLHFILDKIETIVDLLNILYSEL